MTRLIAISSTSGQLRPSHPYDSPSCGTLCKWGRHVGADRCCSCNLWYSSWYRSDPRIFPLSCMLSCWLRVSFPWGRDCRHRKFHRVAASRPLGHWIRIWFSACGTLEQGELLPPTGRNHRAWQFMRENLVKLGVHRFCAFWRQQLLKCTGGRCWTSV